MKEVTMHDLVTFVQSNAHKPAWEQPRIALAYELLATAYKLQQMAKMQEG